MGEKKVRLPGLACRLLAAHRSQLLPTSCDECGAHEACEGGCWRERYPAEAWALAELASRCLRGKAWRDDAGITREYWRVQTGALLAELRAMTRPVIVLDRVYSHADVIELMHAVAGVRSSGRVYSVRELALLDGEDDAADF